METEEEKMDGPWYLNLPFIETLALPSCLATEWPSSLAMDFMALIDEQHPVHSSRFLQTHAEGHSEDFFMHDAKQNGALTTLLTCPRWNVGLQDFS